jgi:hypothetical protein
MINLFTKLKYDMDYRYDWVIMREQRIKEKEEEAK